MSVRLRRLQAEFERLKIVFAGHERIRIVDAIGIPPDRYVVEYRVKGLVEENDDIHEREVHRAEIALGPGYPREMPRCVMLTPVFHPNIDHLAICTEDIGSAGRTLDQTIIFIGEMISFQTYNLQSPRNGDAARWTKENANALPLESVNLVPSILMAGDTEAEIARAAAQAAIQATHCGNCGSTDYLRPCSYGHLSCEDCRLVCSKCATEICAICARTGFGWKPVCDACARVVVGVPGAIHETTF